jgi:hypothetical protein
MDLLFTLIGLVFFGALAWGLLLASGWLIGLVQENWKLAAFIVGAFVAAGSDDNAVAHSQHNSPTPSHTGYEGYARYEVRRGNKNADLPKNAPSGETGAAGGKVVQDDKSAHLTTALTTDVCRHCGAVMVPAHKVCFHCRQPREPSGTAA